MKWYDIKEYYPPTSCDLLIRTANKGYERYFIAMIEDHRVMEDPLEWEYSNGQIPDPYLFENCTVTHFCVIEPVLREDLGDI